MIRKFEMTITPFRLSRRVHLYLPDDYRTGRERYPVIYMYDGHNLFFDDEATYGKSWGLKDFLDKYDKKFIVAGLECSHEGNERLNEFCPYQVEDSWTGAIRGKGDMLMDWMVGELKPYMDSTYPTIPDREHTMIGGSSMGGLMALYSVIAHNDVFSRAACLSSAVSFCMEELKNEISCHELKPDTRIYMDWGSEEMEGKDALVMMTDANLELAHLLSEKGASVYPRMVAGGCHNEATWEKQIPVFMDYLWERRTR